MRRVPSFILALLFCVSIAGCQKPNASAEVPPDLVDITSGAKEEEIIITYSDLTHDGNEEKVMIDISQLKEKQTAILKVLDEKDNIIWEESAGTAHAGWNSIYLYTLNGEDYLLRYNPYIVQGIADYKYELFYLDENGSEKHKDFNSLHFDITGCEHPLDVEKIVSFVDEVNEYLSKSILLLSTQDSELVHSTSKDRIVKTEELSWLNDYDIEYDDHDSLKDKLEKYQEHFTD